MNRSTVLTFTALFTFHFDRAIAKCQRLWISPSKTSTFWFLGVMENTNPTYRSFKGQTLPVFLFSTRLFAGLVCLSFKRFVVGCRCL